MRVTQGIVDKNISKLKLSCCITVVVGVVVAAEVVVAVVFGDVVW